MKNPAEIKRVDRMALKSILRLIPLEKKHEETNHENTVVIQVHGMAHGGSKVLIGLNDKRPLLGRIAQCRPEEVLVAPMWYPGEVTEFQTW